jgi:Ca-activated chloride channel family protein
MIAEVGGGSFYKVIDPQSLPRVFTRETEMVSRSAAVEEYFQPKRGVPGGLPSRDRRRGRAVSPRIRRDEDESDARAGDPRERAGRADPRAMARRPRLVPRLDERREEPLGRRVATLAETGAQFWGQLVREHMRQKKHQTFDMRAEIDTATGNVRAVLDAVGLDDRFQNGLEASLTVTGPEPGGTTRKIAMPQTAPGRYESDFPARSVRVVLAPCGAPDARGRGQRETGDCGRKLRTRE